MTELERLMKLGRDQAEKVLIGTKKELLAMFVLVKRDGAVDIVATPWENDKAKHQIVLNICLNVIKENVTSFSFLSEAWFATVHTESGDLPPPIGPRPADRPDRKESVICITGDGKEQGFESWPIIRDAKGRCTELGTNLYKDKVGFDSWIATAINRAILINLADPEGEFRKKIEGWPI